MKLYLIRHGETEINQKGSRFQGMIDIPLNETGLRQAMEARDAFQKKNIAFQHVIASPLSRAFETVRIVSGFPAEQILTDERLLEQDFGPYEGHVWGDMNPRTLYALLHDPLNYFPPEAGMESVIHVVQRASLFLQDMKRRADEFQGNVLAGAHGGSIRGMLVTLHELDINKFWEYRMGNCAWYELTLRNGDFMVTARSE
ncbi:MAG: histidine phosphatase family protein [Blautia sp.]|nr:histidine phosphatase family protein [Blautia sp.]